MEEINKSKNVDITVKLFDHRNKVHSRDGGKEFLQCIESILPFTSCVVVDFNGVNVISSGFADEVFGRLFVKIGPMEFMNCIKLHNIDSTSRMLVDRAILMRSKATC